MAYGVRRYVSCAIRHELGYWIEVRALVWLLIARAIDAHRSVASIMLDASAIPLRAMSNAVP